MTITATEQQSTALTPETARQLFTDWLDALQAGAEARDEEAVAALMGDDVTLRDLTAFAWTIESHRGAADVAAVFTEQRDRDLVQPFAIREGSDVTIDTAAGPTDLTGYFSFTTQFGYCVGRLRLNLAEDGSVRATRIVAKLEELAGHPENLGAERPIGRMPKPQMNRQNWADTHDKNFTNADPQVLIVGGGHNGLILAARLIRQGVSVLVVEKNQRVGDNWRKRYPSLALHDPVSVVHFPYMPLPETWPMFTPKDKVADYLESYALMLDIPVWTGSSVDALTYDEANEKWVAEITRPDGTRTLNVNHVTIASGPHGRPKIPTFPGQENFAGDVIHSSQFTGGRDWSGKRVVVVGAGTSGHDIAQDLVENGAEATLVQRSPQLIVNQATVHALNYGNFIAGLPTEDADLNTAEMPFGVYPEMGKGWMQAVEHMDAELYDGLKKVGFDLNYGPDGEGLLGLIFRENRYSYYYNVGASELIVDGTIKLHHGEVEHFTPTGVVIGGEELNADLVVLATGYTSPRDSVRPLLGDEIVDQLPPLYEVGEDMELQGVWKHSGKDRLWFMLSTGILYSRFYSKVLALQIAAIEAGMMPANPNKA